MDRREAESEKTDRWEADGFACRRLLAGRRLDLPPLQPGVAGKLAGKVWRRRASAAGANGGI